MYAIRSYYGIARVARRAGVEGGELGGHGLARDHATGAARERHHRRVERRADARVDRRAAGGRPVDRRGEVLDPDRQTAERPGVAVRVGARRGGEPEVGIERGPGLQLGLGGGDASYNFV